MVLVSPRQRSPPTVEEIIAILRVMTNKLQLRLVIGSLLISVLVLAAPGLFWVYILASMYWTTNVQAVPYEPWDGCAAPTSEAELAQWIAHSEKTGEPLCDPDVVDMTFDE